MKRILKFFLEFGLERFPTKESDIIVPVSEFQRWINMGMVSIEDGIAYYSDGKNRLEKKVNFYSINHWYSHVVWCKDENIIR